MCMRLQKCKLKKCFVVGLKHPRSDQPLLLNVRYTIKAKLKALPISLVNL